MRKESSEKRAVRLSTGLHMLHKAGAGRAALPPAPASQQLPAGRHQQPGNPTPLRPCAHTCESALPRIQGTHTRHHIPCHLRRQRVCGQRQASAHWHGTVNTSDGAVQRESATNCCSFFIRKKLPTVTLNTRSLRLKPWSVMAYGYCGRSVGSRSTAPLCGARCITVDVENDG